jgi:hypothetical protein
LRNHRDVGWAVLRDALVQGTREIAADGRVFDVHTANALEIPQDGAEPLLFDSGPDSEHLEPRPGRRASLDRGGREHRDRDHEENRCADRSG